MFSKLHLKYKLILGFLVVSLFALVGTGIEYYYSHKVIGTFEHIVDINMANVERMALLKDSVRILRTRTTFIVGFPTGHDEEVKDGINLIQKEITNYEMHNKAFHQAEFADGEEALYKKVEESWKVVKARTLEILDVYSKQGGQAEASKLFFAGYAKATYDYFDAIEALINFEKKQTDLWQANAKKTGADASVIAISTMTLGFIISMFIGVSLARAISNQLAEAINELNTSTPELTQSAGSMSSLSIELSSCATEQAAAVQETAASLEEISAMISRNTENANNAKNSSTSSLNSVKQGQHAVSNMLKAMEEINQNNEAFNQFMSKNNAEMSEMVQVISNISEKTKIINDIVFQTKLLSFNASVEAARAGEQGKGFAVVAEEVGNLAQMSGNAANEIKGLLDESIVKVSKIVTTTKTQVDRLIIEGKEKVESGITKARECDVALNEINKAVASVEVLVTEVSVASAEQSQGIQEVNRAMGQIDEVTNQNSIASQSVAANATQVMGLSTSISATADKLLLLLIGGKVVTETKRDQAKAPAKATVKVGEKSAKVIAIKKTEERPPMKMVKASAPAKKTGTDGQLPSYDDKRFEDV